MSINTLRRYHLEEQRSAEPTTLEGFIPYTVNGRNTLRKARFFTTNEFPPNRYEPRAVGNYLAVTFYPRWNNEFDVTPRDSDRVRLTNPYLGDQPTRIWPAFGKDGGACEIAMTEGCLTSVRNTEEFLTGGGGEPFWQDGVLAGTMPADLGLVDLAEKIGDWFAEAKKAEEPQNPSIKVVPPTGTAIAWIGGRTRKRYSISCAYEPTTANRETHLLFWGDVWEDGAEYSQTEGESQRSVCSLGNPAAQRVYELPVREMRRMRKEHIYGELSDLLIRLVDVARDFRNPRVIHLPPYVQLVR